MFYFLKERIEYDLIDPSGERQSRCSQSGKLLHFMSLETHGNIIPNFNYRTKITQLN